MWQLISWISVISCFSEAIVLAVYCQAWYFSKLKEIFFFPYSYHLVRVLIFIPVLISSYNVLSSCLQILYSILTFWRIEYCFEISNLFFKCNLFLWLVLALVCEWVIVNLRIAYLKNSHFYLWLFSAKLLFISFLMRLFSLYSHDSSLISMFHQG